jgi:crossover junction endonuclease MUS81
VIGELKKNGVILEVVRLSVGDFVWVCREKANTAQNRNRLTISRSAELVLPYVVERKRSDDLAGSIKDGRFHEQKFRLQQTGLTTIYLIESYGNGDWGLADGALNQAVANTQMTNHFLIQETTCIKDTCAYLTHMTRHLSKMFEVI